MTGYILFCALYRTVCGALLLVTGWNLAIAQPNHFDALAMATFLSFVPALAIPLVLKWLPRRFIGRDGFATCLVLLAGLGWVASGILHLSGPLVVLTFLLWSVFFAIEPLIEAWFVALSVGLNDKQISKYSSLSMTVNQCCLMVGPVLAYQAVAIIGPVWFMRILAGLFGAMAVLNLYLMGETQGSKAACIDRVDVRAELRALLPLCLIWPTLGCFNFMVPVYFNLHVDGNMAKAGIIDGCLGVGMALAGVWSMVSLFGRPRWRNLAALGWIVAGAAIWNRSNGNIYGCATATAMLGLGFGAMRIGCRVWMARNFSASKVARLVSRGNALSLLVLFTSLAASRIDYAWAWLSPFGLAFLLVMVAEVVFRDVPAPLAQSVA